MCRYMCMRVCIYIYIYIITTTGSFLSRKSTISIALSKRERKKKNKCLMGGAGGWGFGGQGESNWKATRRIFFSLLSFFLFLSPFQTNLGNLMGGPGSSVLGSAEQNAHSLSAVSASSCGVSMGPANNGIYTSDTSASMLGCLLPSLPSLPSLSSPHDVFRHGEMLRAYHDPTRQHARHLQRTDVT